MSQDPGLISEDNDNFELSEEVDTVPDLPTIIGQLSSLGWKTKPNRGEKGSGIPPPPSTPPPGSPGYIAP